MMHSILAPIERVISNLDKAVAMKLYLKFNLVLPVIIEELTRYDAEDSKVFGYRHYSIFVEIFY